MRKCLVEANSGDANLPSPSQSLFDVRISNFRFKEGRHPVLKENFLELPIGECVR